MDTFTLFPLLPPELRFKIWSHTFEPQILEYRLLTTYVPGIIETLPGDPKCYNHFTPTAPQSLPIALSVNAESRAYALSHYSASAYSTAPPPPLADYADLAPRAVYFHPDLDIVGFENLRDNLEAAACWRRRGRQQQQQQGGSMVRGAYGAAPGFGHVKRLLLNATDWAECGVFLGLGERGPGAGFFGEFFTAVEEVLLAADFNIVIPSEVRLEEVRLGWVELWERKCAMERDFRDVLRAKIPGWKAPRVTVVRSRTDMTVVMPGVNLGSVGGLETEAVYEINKDYWGNPRPREFGSANE